MKCYEPIVLDGSIAWKPIINWIPIIKGRMFCDTLPSIIQYDLQNHFSSFNQRSSQRKNTRCHSTAF